MQQHQRLAIVASLATLAFSHAAYAAATTDTGHSGTGLTAEWAVGHQEKLVDFGHRAVHLMTVTAKQAIARCSTHAAHEPAAVPVSADRGARWPQ